MIANVLEKHACLSFDDSGFLFVTAVKCDIYEFWGIIHNQFCFLRCCLHEVQADRDNQVDHVFGEYVIVSVLAAKKDQNLQNLANKVR